MFKQFVKLPLLIGITLLVAGCGLVDEIKSASSNSPPVAAKPAPPKVSQPARPAADTKKATPDARGAQAAAKNPEGAKPAEIFKEETTIQAERKAVNLVGRDQVEVARVLGPPMSETEKAPGKVWRYWNSRCSIDVSMYLDVQSRSYRVLAYEVMNHDNSAGGRSACLAEFPKHSLQPASDSGR